MHLGVAEWVVLALIDQRATHGFAVAALTARDGELGRIWHLPRPVVYRALGRLHEAGMVAPSESESGPGPQRTPYSATAQGHRAVLDWLEQPVDHVRELRSHFLLKLALHERRGTEPTELVARQRAVLVPIAEALAAERSASSGFDGLLLAWRAAATGAALTFLEEMGDRRPARPT